MKYQKIRQQAFRSAIWLVAALFITSLSPGNALAATGISVGSGSLNLGATENLYYGAMGTGSSATGGGILIQKPGGTNIFKVDALGGGYFAGNVGIGMTNPAFQLTTSSNDNYVPTVWLGQADPTVRYQDKERFSLYTNNYYSGLRTQSMKWRYLRIEADIKSTDADHYGFFWSSDKTTIGGDSNAGYKWVFFPSGNTLNIRDINTNADRYSSSALPFDEKDGVWHHYVTELTPDNRVKVWVDGIKYIDQSGYNPGQGYAGISNYTGTIQVSNFKISAIEGDNNFPMSGYVGIGATNPQTPLHIINATDAPIRLQTTSGGNLSTQITQYYTSWFGLTHPFIIQGVDGSGTSDMVFTPTVNTPTSGLVIKASGNIGIGLTDPTWKLHVYSTSNTSLASFVNTSTGTNSYSQIELKAGSAASYLWTANQNSTSWGGANSLNIYAGTGGAMTLWSNATEQVRIKVDGNVGINTTNPTQKLHVNGGAQFDAIAWGISPGSSQSLALATVGYVNAASASGTWTKSGTSIYPTTLTDNVGIGTTNPTNKLGIDAGVNTKALTVYTTGNDGNYSAIGFQYSAALPAYGRSEIRNYISNGGAEGNLAFLVNDAGTTLTERMRIVGSSGNVGIGTTNPTSKLTLDGGRAEIRSGGILMLRNAANDYDFDIQQIGYTLQFGSASMSNVAMTYDTTGNVGIGLTNPSYSLDIKSGGTPIRIGSTHTGYGATIEMDANVYGAGGRRWIVFSSGSTNGTIGGGKFALYDASGISPDSAAYRFLIDTAGNVGIGTTNPTRKLSISAPAGNGAGIGLSTNLTGTEQEIFRVSNTGSGVNDGMLTLSENGVTKVLIGANNARSGAGYFNGGGNIGINTTSPDAQMSGTYGLAIYKSTYPSVGFKNDTTSWLWYGDGAYLKMWNVSAGDMLFAHSGGNIGIGVAPGSYKLDVNGNIRTRANFYADSNYGYGLVGVYNASRYQGVYAMGDSYKLAVDGTAPGSLYGIAWTHENVGGQSKVGLGHQALFMMNGITYTAVGSGVWTNGNVTASGGNVSATGSVSGGTLCIGADCRASWPGVNSDTVDTYHASQLQFYQSNRDFPNGTLIQTNIWYNDASGEPFLLEIEGNSYGNLVPLDLKVQGYIYSSTLINVGGVSNGLNISGLVAFNYNGYLCFWFPSQGYWNGYSIFVNSSYEGVKNNRLVSVTHAAKPGGVTKEVALTAAIRQSLHTSGGTMAGSINMNSNNISGINDLTATKLYVGTIDPLYYLNGVNYATFVSSISGGVKEEYIGKIKLDQKNKITKEYEATIDFSTEAEGSDLWVWHQVVDFNQANVEVLLTPYGQFAQAYYVISGDKLIFRSDRQVELSYRLIGKRWDWQKWPTKAEDQTIKGIEITSKNK